MCSYCNKSGHEERACYLKRLDELTHIMQENNIPLPDAYKDKGSTSNSKGKGQAFMAKSHSSKEWILDLGASYHMGSSKEDFTSLNQSKVPHIFVGDNTKMEVGGKGNVEMEDGEFQNVLYVPNLSSNLLSIY